MRNLKVRETETLKNYLERELVEFESDGKQITIKEDLTPEEVFDLGLEAGKYDRNQFWQKPEEFRIWGDMQAAIDNYQKQSFRTVDSIKVTKLDGEKMGQMVKVYPTYAIDLFNIGVQYGEMNAKETVSS